MKYIPNLVTACCVLHNLCEMHGDHCEEDWVVADLKLRTADPTTTPTGTSTVAMPYSGSDIREALCDYFEGI